MQTHPRRLVHRYPCLAEGFDQAGNRVWHCISCPTLKRFETHKGAREHALRHHSTGAAASADASGDVSGGGENADDEYAAEMDNDPDFDTDSEGMGVDTMTRRWWPC